MRKILWIASGDIDITTLDLGEERASSKATYPMAYLHGSHKETSTHTPKHSSEAATPADSTGTETSTETGNSPNHGNTHQLPSQHYS